MPAIKFLTVNMMCAFLSRPHLANPHLFEQRNLYRADISATTAVRAGCSSNPFSCVRKFPQHLPSKAWWEGSSILIIQDVPNPSVSNFVARSIANRAFDFLPPASVSTLSDSEIPFQSTEISNVYHFLSGIVNDVTPIDVLSLTFVATVLGIMAAYIVYEVKDYGGSSSRGPLDYKRQSISGVVNASSTPQKYVVTEAPDIWLNLSGQSAFFRSVCARCPSLSASPAYQYVETLRFKKPDYQRQCLPAPDGGTVALDWPAHLDIDGSKELENIMLLVCGTPEGSHEDGIVKFSQLVEQHGYFPIVFNPRGCGGSPVTTPRVFSAADSDDVRLAVQFIAKSRPWATILSVGWGLGANILSKYLGEEGSYTPLTAAVCIDNPFDLSAVRRPKSGSRWLDFDHALSKGLVQILESNKMAILIIPPKFVHNCLSRVHDSVLLRDYLHHLVKTRYFPITFCDEDMEFLWEFIWLLPDEQMRQLDRILHKTLQILFQGQRKGFDVNGALAATSIRDFDRAISRAVHGYETLEDFYADISSGAILERVQIPLLCIQHLEDYTRTQDSIPNHVFERNVYTMQLMSRPSASKDDYPGAASEWTHAISLEWLIAVEISILKGRHPQLSEFSPTIKLPRDWSNAGNQYSAASSKPVDQNEATSVFSNTFGNSYHKEDVLTEKAESTGRSAVPSKGSDGEGEKASESPADFEEGQQTDQQLVEEGLTEAEEAERGHAVQVAETVINVLGVTMPGTLADAQKEQVLKAVGRGETIVTALEEAVPEDVRGKMSSAVSEVVQAQSLSLKSAGDQMSAQKMPTGVIDSIQGTLVGLSDKKEAPTSELDVSSISGNESSDDKGISGHVANNDEPVKGTTPGKSDTTSKKEKPASNDEKKDTAATKRDENSDPSKTVHLSSKDSEDSMQQKDTENKSVGVKKGSGDDLLKGSSKLEDQARDQVDQGKKQPRGSAGEGRKGTHSGGNSEATSRSDNFSAKIEGGEHGLQQSSSSEEKDNAKDVKGQADSEVIRGASVTEKNAQIAKDAGSKGEVTALPSNDDLKSPQSDAPGHETSGSSPSSQPPSPQMPRSDSPAPSDNSKSPASGPEASVPPSTEVPTDTSKPVPTESSNPPPASSEGSQSDPLRTEVSADAPNSTPSISEASQSDALDTQMSAIPSSPPPAPTNAAPQDLPPKSQPVPVPSVGEALQTLTGFDDSTQMAVTNVFGVVENVLDQLEKDRPNPDAKSSGKMSAEVINPTTVEMSKKLAQNDPDASEPEDEDESDLGTGEKKSKEVALGPTNLQKGSPQSRVEIRQAREKSISTGSPLDGEREAAENGSSFASAGRLGVKPFVSKNERGYIKDASVQQRGLDSEVQDNRPNRHSTLLLSANSPNSVHESPPQDTVDNGSITESANEKRLKDMAAEIDAEDEETAESAGSDHSVAESTETGVQQSSMVADLIMKALKLELLRRLGATGLETLGVDVEQEVARVAGAVSEVVTMGKNKLLGEGSHELNGAQGLDSNLGGKVGVLNGKSIVTALGSVLGSNSLLGQLLPFGVLAGVVMAALGATYLIVSDDQDEELAQIQRKSSTKEDDNNASSARNVGSHLASYNGESDDESSGELGSDVLGGLGQDRAEQAEHNISSEKGGLFYEVDGVTGSASTTCSDGEEKSPEPTEESELPHQGKFTGAMAAAMGATAAVASTSTNTSEGDYGDHQSNQGGERKLVPDIAAKAISMVSPVVPRTQGGELDHERLVAVLTEVGQKGGPLTLIGKVALLWGGLRGAMSLADRLLSFLRIKERPLYQRLLGFGGMAILLWTPVLVPLLPTLLQQWATKAPSGVADAAAGIGLYGAVFILVMIWGRRVRDYDRPLVSYGLHLFSKAKLRLFAGGLAIGLGLVSGYYGISWVLGYSKFAWDAIVITNPNFPEPLGSIILTSWKASMLVIQSLAMAVSAALVEEVLFRAWLQEEIAADLGYHWAVALSALAFAVVHWSPAAIGGLWFLGLALAGARARTDGDLSFPIGIHAGIVSCFSVMSRGGLVHYVSETPVWITGAYAGNPLAGAIGTGMIAALAVALYPRQEDKFSDEK